MSQTVNDLFQAAGNDGLLSPQSVHALTNDPDLGANVQRAFNTAIQPVGAPDVMHFAFLIDDSGSIAMHGNTEAIREGYNLVLDAIIKSKQRDNIFLRAQTLNGTTISPFVLVDQAPRLTPSNYDDPRGGTPLYDASFDLLGEVIAESERYRNEYSIMTQTVTVLLTDGHDEHSRRHRDPKALRQVIQDLNDTEDHIVAAIGVDDGRTDFRYIFHDQMGIRESWILTPKSDPSEIRRAFRVFSETLVQMSQSAAAFQSQAGFGGFGGTS